jgi:hypothetical protein
MIHKSAEVRDVLARDTGEMTYGAEKIYWVAIRDKEFKATVWDLKSALEAIDELEQSKENEKKLYDYEKTFAAIEAETHKEEPSLDNIKSTLRNS